MLMNRFFKYACIQTALLSLCISSHVNAMRTGSDFWDLLPMTQEQRIQEAKKYNKNHVLINEDFLRIIFSYCEQQGKQEHISHWTAYDQAKTLASLHIACQCFNTLMPFKKIIEFCKRLNNEIKNELLWVALARRDQTSYDDLIFSAVIQAGADLTTKYQGVPLFFYAKSIKMAQGFINRGCDIYREYGQFNIVSYVGTKEYPSELMEFYLNKGIVPPQRILHGLILELKTYCDNQKLMDEFFKKAELLLTKGPNSIKNDLNWEHHTPLNRLLSTDAVCSPEFKERLIDLFFGYGCQTTSAIANNYLRNTSYFDVNNTLIDEYIFDDVKVVAEERPRQVKVFNSKAAYSLVESIQKNNAHHVTLEYHSLMQAVQNKDIATVSALMDKGRFDINERDEFGNTLLIAATMKKDREMIKHLLNHSADPELVNKLGYTALEMAMNNGDDDIATLLIDASEAH